MADDSVLSCADPAEAEKGVVFRSRQSGGSAAIAGLSAALGDEGGQMTMDDLPPELLEHLQEQRQREVLLGE